jgi:hypothetical protein
VALIDIGEAGWRCARCSSRRRSAATGWPRACSTSRWRMPAHGAREVLLGTTEAFLAAHRFYEKHGFACVERAALPAAFPVMAVDTRFYRLALASPSLLA